MQATTDRLAFIAGLALLALATAQGGTVTWDGSTDTNWTGGTDATSWSGGTYNDGDDALFGNTGVGAVVLSGTVSPASVTFNHASGTYQFDYVAGNNISATGNLAVTGGGTVQFGNMTNSPGGLANLVTWAGTTMVSGGSTLNLTRPGTLGGSGQVVTLNAGTLRLGADNSGTYTTANPFAIGAGGGTIVAQYSGNQSVFTLSGDFTGGGSLVLRTDGNANNLRNASGLRISGADNSGFTGSVLIDSNVKSGTTPAAGQWPAGAVTFNSSGALFANASSVTVRDGGVFAVSYAAAATVFDGLTIGAGGGIGATGATGSLAALGNPMAYVGSGGMLLLDNMNNLNSDRILDTAPLAFDNNRFHLIGRNANSSPTNEVAGALSFSGSALLSMDRPNSNSSGVKLTVASLASPSPGNTLLISAATWGDAVGLNHLMVTGSKPAVSNGMVSPGIQQFDGANILGNFVTFSGNDLVVATYNSNDINTAVVTDLVNIGASVLASSKSVHAVRISGNLDLGANTLTLGSGGFITSSNTTSNGTLDFGSGPGFIGAYNAAAQANFSAKLSGSGGLTIFGASQSANLTNNANDFTGGLFVNGGTVSATETAVNGNDVTVNVYGRFNTGNTANDVTIGGLSGTGRVAAHFQGNNTTTGSLVINPAAGSYEFSGRIANGDAGRVLSITKSGNGTQIFSGSNAYTGNTTVSGGTLVLNRAAALPGYGTAGKVSVGGLGTLTVRAGGADEWTEAQIASLLANGTFNSGSVLGVDTTGGNFTYAGSLSGNYGLRKSGSNSLTLAGNTSFDGPVAVTAGTLIVNGTHSGLGTVTVDSGAILKGSGSLAGPVTVGANARVAPGTSPGELVVDSIVFEAGSYLDIELGGTSPVTEHDVLTAIGTIILNGGTLAVVSYGGYVFQQGDVFDIFNGTIAGAFEAVDLPALDGSLVWDSSELYSQGILRIVAIPEPAGLALLGLGAVMGLGRRRRG